MLLTQSEVQVTDESSCLCVCQCVSTLVSSLGNTSPSSLLSIRMLVRGSLPACWPPWSPGDRSLLLFPIPLLPGASQEPGPDYHLEHKAWFASLQAARFAAAESPASWSLCGEENRTSFRLPTGSETSSSFSFFASWCETRSRCGQISSTITTTQHNSDGSSFPTVSSSFCGNLRELPPPAVR